MNGGRFRLAILLALLVLCLSLAQEVTVQTSKGKIIGSTCGTKGNARQFYGIPYAAAPVGDLRWRPTQPYAQPYPEAGLNATVNQGQMCPQYSHYPSAGPAGTEDCLVLNVWTPTAPLARGKPYPVLIEIHGGGFVSGSGFMYPGAMVCEFVSVTNYIYVSINYRLGVLGFLGLPELMEEMPDERTTGNYGLQDQRMAMQWVKDHISAFGGDPTKVTIQGSSAGGMSVFAHLVSHRSAGLFRGAMPQESAMDTVFQTLPMAYNFGSSSVKDVLCNGTTTAAATLQCLRSVPFMDIADLPVSRHAPSPHEWVLPTKFGPTIDGYEFTTRPLDLIRSGQVNKVPVWLGSTSQEGAFFEWSSSDTSVPVYSLQEVLSTFDIDGVFAKYLAAQYNTSRMVPFGPPGVDAALGRNASAVIQMMTEFGFKCHERRVAQALETHSLGSWVWEFCGLSDASSPWRGSGHGAFAYYEGYEMLYTNGSTAAMKELSVRFSSAEAYFVHTLNPNPPRQTTPWPKYDSCTPTGYVFGPSQYGSLDLRYLEEVCRVWDHLDEYYWCYKNGLCSLPSGEPVAVV